MIKIKNLNKSYKNNHVLKDLSMTINKGDIYGFLGNNGAGKTTTLNIMNQLIKYNSGSCELNGQIGYLPESPVFYDYMTAKEYLRLIGELRNNNSEPYINELLWKVGLTSKKRIGSFSRGMKQRLGMAVAIYHKPEILLLDEPTSALDPEGRKDVMALIKQLNEEGMTIVFSTHILDDVERLCNRIGILKDGHLIFEDHIHTLPKAKENTYCIQSPTLTKEKIMTLFDTKDVTDHKTYFEVKTEHSNCFKVLAASGHKIEGFTKKEVTLEDIFIRMVQHDI